MDSAEPTLETELPPLKSGDRVGSFTVLRPLKQGGMAVVYEAVGQSGNRAAIKVLRTSMLANQEVVLRFKDEAKAINLVAPLTRGVVGVYDTLELPGGATCIIMEYLEGESLQERMARLAAAKSPPGTQEFRLFQQLAAAITKTHAAGVVHRDVKPGNVMIIKDDAVTGGERAKLIDFGVAKVPKPPQAAETEIGKTIGTHNYAAPETHGAANLATGKSDVYALGIMIYELCAGAPPFADGSTVDVLTRHRWDTPPDLATRRKGLPADIYPLVRRMLAKSPDGRPDMEEVTAVLGRAIERPAPSPSPLRLVLLVMGLVGLLAITTVLVAVRRDRGGAPPPGVHDASGGGPDLARGGKPDLAGAPSPDLAVTISPDECADRADGPYCVSPRGLVVCKAGRVAGRRQCPSGCVTKRAGMTGACGAPPKPDKGPAKGGQAKSKSLEEGTKKDDEVHGTVKDFSNLFKDKRRGQH